MDDILMLIDALRERGAIKITTKDVSVEFASPLSNVLPPEPVTPVVERALDLAEVERLMYTETSKL